MPRSAGGRHGTAAVDVAAVSGWPRGEALDRDRRAITDAELVAQALAGSEEAYGALVQRFQRPVLTVIGRLVRDRMLAEDLAQETFVKAFRNLRRYDARRKLASWIFKIAHNTAIDHLRRKRLPTDSLDAPDREGEAPRETVAAPQAQAPDRVVEGSALAAAIEAALGSLRPAYREVLTLRFQEGLAYEEIAEVVGLPLGTVKVHLHRGRKQLAAALEAAGWGWAKQDPRACRRGQRRG